MTPEKSTASHADFDPHSQLIRAARGVLSSTENALDGTTTWLALTDPAGVVTYEWASTTRLEHQLASAEVKAGAVFAEHLAGTNGVGVALATRTPALVQGPEHYNEYWHNLACAASPVVHPVTREVLGSVNITCLVHEQNQHLKITLNSLVSGIQQALSAGTKTRHQRLLDAHLRVKNATRSAVVTLDKHTMIVEEDYDRFMFDRESLWALLEGVGPMATELMLPGGQRVQLVPVASRRISEGCSLVFSQRTIAELVATRTSISASHEKIGNVSRDHLGPLEQAEYDVIVAVVRECNGNKSDAAERLRISRGTLYERLKRYGLQM